MNDKILIIDDDFLNCKLINRILRQSDFEFSFEFKFLDEWYFKKFQDVDIILYNADFAEVGKNNFISCITSINYDIPFLLMLSNQHVSLINKYVDEGVDDFVYLPFNGSEISTVIKKNIYQKKIRTNQKKDIKQETLVKLLIPLMRALDAKDNYTLEHTKNVAALSMKMAEKLKLNFNEKMLLQISAYFHDIGKIGIPDSILHKSGSLHEEEFLQIKSHPVIGSEIIGEIEELREVATIIRHHHERYDGSGYPDGLKGEEIPYFSRILTIVDTFEALISRRVYKDEIDEQHVLNEIKSNAGIQFDPNLVDVFLNVIKSEDQAESFNEQFFFPELFDKFYCRTDSLTA